MTPQPPPPPSPPPPAPGAPGAIANPPPDASPVPFEGTPEAAPAFADLPAAAPVGTPDAPSGPPPRIPPPTFPVQGSLFHQCGCANDKFDFKPDNPQFLRRLSNSFLRKTGDLAPQGWSNFMWAWCAAVQVSIAAAAATAAAAAAAAALEPRYRRYLVKSSCLQNGTHMTTLWLSRASMQLTGVFIISSK